jgi:serine protein kinase
MSIFDQFPPRYAEHFQQEMSLMDYLELCRDELTTYATASERMSQAIGEPELLDMKLDPNLGRICSNKVMKIYPAFREFYEMEETIEQIVAYFRHAARGLEERKQILCLLGPVGGGKSSIAEKLKVFYGRFSDLRN